ncbi:hypothetical protein [Aeromonas veronii]|uniref:hypothetical protein n=1 Tax=Aeromonas veronii TaxID=654 RepID=UPI001E4FA6F3|nr:hypothetical protein [Aeromonas veronii]MCD6619541.1 hypothetical protein [Aeromonas veronii]
MKKNINDLTRDDFLKILVPEQDSKNDGSIVVLSEKDNTGICVITDNELQVFTESDLFNQSVSQAFERRVKIDDVLNSIEYQNRKISTLIKIRQEYMNLFLTSHALEQKSEQLNDLKNISQILHDGLLNAFASILDYYNIAFMLRLGAPFDKISKVQHQRITNEKLMRQSGKNDIESFLGDLNVQLKSNNTLKVLLNNDNLWEYRYYLYGDLISKYLKHIGVVATNHQPYQVKGDQIIFCEIIKDYLNYTRGFFCTKLDTYGVGFNIYLDINNFLKHNTVPFFTPHIETFDNEETRVYAYFKIEKSQYIYLNNGIVKHFASYDFDKLRACLQEKESGAYTTAVEDEIGLPGILTVDNKNGFENKNENGIYFYLDDVLIMRERNSIFIDSMSSLVKVYHRLWREIERCIPNIKPPQS